MDFVSVEKLIKILKEKNINFGKGNPYNRLRYYTKIGWLPHMTRKKNEEGVITGHYPTSVIDTIEKIELLKQEGRSNEEINLTFKKRELINKESIRILDFIKKININYLILLLIIAGFIIEIFRNNSPNEKIINTEIQENKSIVSEKKIVDSGVSFLQKNQNLIFIASGRVSPTSIILLNFFNNIGYNNNYYIKEIKVGQGFYIETNYQVPNESKFNWVIIE
jgi:hypothetical protein